MNKLLKKYNLNSDMQYYELMRGYYTMGKYDIAKEMFNELPKAGKSDFIRSIMFYQGDFSQKEQEYFFNLFEKL